MNQGKSSVYLLLVVTGLLIGAIGGGEIVRRWYAETPANSSTRPAQPAMPRSASAGTTPPAGGDVDLSRRNAIVSSTKKVAPGVVGIVVTKLQLVRSPYYFGDFWDLFVPEISPRYKEVQNMGSGFIIDGKGLVLTNSHVIGSPQEIQRIYVNFPDGRQMDGSIVGIDAETDLALLKVKEGRFPAAHLGNSDDIMIGEWAIAIGNPFGYFINDAHPTVTVGVISALNRNFAPSEGVTYQGMIQTDAAINPGNSGGPLVNALGQVVGINTFIYTGSSSNKGSIGIGFAIPVNRAKRVVQELVTHGRRRPVWTGLFVHEINRSLALSLGYDRLDGVAVQNVVKGSPGDQAGLQSNDIVRQMGNRKIIAPADLEGVFLDYFVGDVVPISYVRRGQERQTTLVLKEYQGE